MTHWHLIGEVPHAQPLHVMIWGGEQGFDYAAILEYLEYLDDLDVPAEQLIASGVDHTPILFSQAHGAELLRLHDRHCGGVNPETVEMTSF